jgi:hypothetical protein
MKDHLKIRGSVMLSVIIFSSVMLVLIASLLSWGVTERRLNARSQLRLESRNAAEALAEYGLSQIRQKFETRSTFSLDPDGSDALVQPGSSFWAGGNVDVVTTELVGGTIIDVKSPGSDYYFIDPADKNNENDPLKGKYVFRRDVRVIAKATVIPPNGGSPLTSYVTERISVRGAPLFAHAIFYNMDLEIFNGPEMTISGPVHANGDLFLYPESGALTFTSQVTATGNIYHGKKSGDNSTDGNSASGRTAEVRFKNKSSDYVNLRGADLVWNDSTRGAGTAGTFWSENPSPGFRAHAAQTWNGNLLTKSHGVSNYTPVALGAYEEDPTPSNGTDNSVNSGRNIIEPSSYPTTDPAVDTNYARKNEVEFQKYSNNAGLYIKVDPATGTITGAYSRDKDTPVKNKVLTLPSSANLVAYKPYTVTVPYTSTETTKTYEVTTSRSTSPKYKYTLKTVTKTANSTITYTKTGSSTSVGTFVSPVTTWGTESDWRSTPPGSNTGPTISGTAPSETSAGATISSGMYDNHRDKRLDIIELDIDALRKAVARMVDSTATSTTLSTGTGVVVAGDTIGNLSTADWTGIVYIEVAGAPTTDPITGATNAATVSKSLETGVRIINGKGKVPSYVGTNGSEGLTIATNVPVYVKGSFNANGSTGSTSATTPDDANETPAAIVGDAITILSENFNDSTSRSSANPTATTSTIEISAALLTGLAPTNKNGNGKTSGGAHNLPRFLENWSSKSTYIRGSLVALFESRVFTEPHGSGYYSPPARNWGFHDLFKAGRYPPGTPRVMSYRRVDFTDLPPTEYETIKTSFNWDS